MASTCRSASAEVCQVLRARRQEIHDRYARALQTGGGPHYALRPADELVETTRESVLAYLSALCAGNWGPMHAFVEAIAEKRFRMRFPVSEVQKAFALFRSICVPVLTENFRGEKLDEVLVLVDTTVDRAIHLLSDTYERLHQAEIEKASLELREAHRRVQAQYQEVAEASQIKSQFFANMSHELRSPMNSIIGYTELLIDEIDGPLNDEQKRSLQKILASSRYLLKLINDVLDMSKIEAGRMEAQSRPFVPRDLVEEAVDTVRPMAYRKRLELRYDVARAPAVFRADPEKVKQVLINLLTNAVKFTEEGEVVCTVEEVTQGLRLEVRDTGIGISAEEQGRIFHKFYQSAESRGGEYRGTGLGLALSRMLVELMGGRIEVRSEPGRGSSFSVILPEADAGPADAKDGPGAVERPRVLVIEDDPLARELIQKLFESDGIDSLAASDGSEGLRLAREWRPGAITLDLLMPNVDGWEVLETLKADAATRSIPVAVVSCVDRKEVGMRKGADAFIVKPIEREGFLRTIRALLAARAAGETS